MSKTDRVFYNIIEKANITASTGTDWYASELQSELTSIGAEMSVSEWQSEEFWIPYISPKDNRVHRYFPDFFLKYYDRNKKRRVMVVEVKPKKQVEKPPQNPKRRTKAWAYSVQTWVVNQAKWKAAKEFCADRGYEFKIMTEDDLGIK